MRVIKKINNNVSLCIDNDGKELVVFGKGIGFREPPYELTDLSEVTMTFYRLDNQFLSLLNEIPEDIFEVSTMIVKYAQATLNKNLNPNIVFSLADHINFAIIRLREYKEIKLLFSYDIEHFYQKETEVGRYAVKLIQKSLLVTLPESEITNIAMHFINAQSETVTEKESTDIEEAIDKTVRIIEDYFKIKIDSQEFNYNRFIMHLRYFFKRIEQKEQFIDGANELYTFMKVDKPDIYKCTSLIAEYLRKTFDVVCTEDEMLYLMVHINRIVEKGR